MFQDRGMFRFFSVQTMIRRPSKTAVKSIAGKQENPTMLSPDIIVFCSRDGRIIALQEWRFNMSMKSENYNWLANQKAVRRSFSN